MPGIRRLNTQIESSQIPTAAITAANIRLHMETAVATLPPTAAYKTFTTAFGTPPQVRLVFAGTTARNVAGTARVSFDVLRIRPGSFQWRGTPNVRARWLAWGAR